MNWVEFAIGFRHFGWIRFEVKNNIIRVFKLNPITQTHFLLFFHFGEVFFYPIFSPIFLSPFLLPEMILIKNEIPCI